MSVTAPETVEQASHWLRALAGPRTWGETVERGIERGARLAGLSRSQAKRLWYGDLARVDAHVFETLRRKYEALCARQEANLVHELQLLKAVEAETPGENAAPERTDR